MPDFDATYPALARFILAGGALALDEDARSFVSLSAGGCVLWDDWGAFENLADALAAAEAFVRDRSLERREVSLPQWLTTGALGPLELGATVDAVETWLGPPEDFWMRTEGQVLDSYRECEGWSYGDLELHFAHGVLVGMVLPWRGWDQESRALRWSDGLEGATMFDDPMDIAERLARLRGDGDEQPSAPRVSSRASPWSESHRQHVIAVGEGARLGALARREPKAARRLQTMSCAEASLPPAFDRLFAHGVRLSFRKSRRRVHAHVYDLHGWLGSSVTKADRVGDMMVEAGEVARGSLERVREPVSVSLSSFVATGRLGPIALGMSPAEVEARLGPPEDLLFATDEWDHHRRANIWTYHGLELYFEDADEGQGAQGRRLFQISRSALQHHVEFTPSRAFVIDFDVLIDGALPNHVQAEALADRLGLDWEYLFAYEQAHLVLSSGVFFIFEGQHGDDGGVELEWTADNRDRWSLDCRVSYMGVNPQHVARLREMARR